MNKAGLFNPAFPVSAGNQGRFSKQLMNEIVLDFIIWYMKVV
jgi:hypothetical protein